MLPDSLELYYSDYNNFWIFNDIIIRKSYSKDMLGSEEVPGVYYNKVLNQLSLNFTDATISIIQNADSCVLTDYVTCLRDCVVREKSIDFDKLIKLRNYPGYDEDIGQSAISTSYMQINDCYIHVSESEFIERWYTSIDDSVRENICTIATCNSSVPKKYYEDDTTFLIICDKYVAGYKIVSNQCLNIFASIDNADYVFKMLSA